MRLRGRERVSTAVSGWLPSGAPYVFTPLDLSPTLWVDASDTSTITEVAGAVSQIDDKSGNSRNFTQATAAAQPTTGANTQNGLNVLTFDGDGHFLTHDAGSDIIDLSPMTTFMVLYDNNSSQTGSRFRRALAMRRSAQLASDFQTPNFLLYKNDSTRAMGIISRAISTGTITYTNEQWFTATIKASATGGSLQIDDGSPLTTASNNAPDNMRYVRIGATASSGGNPPAPTIAAVPEYWGGFVAELIIYNATLTDTQITEVRNYLNVKWDL